MPNYITTITQNGNRYVIQDDEAQTRLDAVDERLNNLNVKQLTYEPIENKVSSVNSQSTDEQYPTAKWVYDNMYGVEKEVVSSMVNDETTLQTTPLVNGRSITGIATNGVYHIAITSDGIVCKSTNNCESWTQVTALMFGGSMNPTSSMCNEGWVDITYSKQCGFIAISSSGYITWSIDGDTWLEPIARLNTASPYKYISIATCDLPEKNSDNTYRSVCCILCTDGKGVILETSNLLDNTQPRVTPTEILYRNISQLNISDKTNLSDGWVKTLILPQDNIYETSDDEIDFIERFNYIFLNTNGRLYASGRAYGYLVWYGQSFSLNINNCTNLIAVPSYNTKNTHCLYTLVDGLLYEIRVNNIIPKNLDETYYFFMDNNYQDWTLQDPKSVSNITVLYPRAFNLEPFFLGGNANKYQSGLYQQYSTNIIKGSPEPIDSTCFDGQWEPINNHVIYSGNSFKNTIVCNLAGAIPKDDYNYEILITYNGTTGNKSGNIVQCTATTELIPHTMYLMRTLTRSASTVVCSGTTIIPIGHTRELTLSGHTSNTGTMNITLVGKRRIGTNK